MKKFTVYYDQLNRINYQVLAKDKNEARQKGNKLFKEHLYIPEPEIQEGWLVEGEGEDK